jgi:hypothetical protein
MDFNIVRPPPVFRHELTPDFQAAGLLEPDWGRKVNAATAIRPVQGEWLAGDDGALF